MFFVEAEINGQMKKITKKDGEVIMFNVSADAWDFLYDVFKFEEIHIEGVLTKVSEIKSLAVGYEKQS